MMEKSVQTAEKCQKILKDVFGYDSFRGQQLDVILSVLSGKDTLAIMPTGGGKSVCYQVPALLFSGITVVVSPLISLMQDQVSSLTENGVNAIFLNSSLGWDEYVESVQQLKRGQVKIVYVSPEGLLTERMQSVLHDCEIPVSCITVDEAHCVSDWGHDFRPDYLNIISIRRQFPNAVCLALTATATEQVRQDIMHNLGMKNPAVFIASFNRSNIFLEVRPKKNADFQIKQYLYEHKGDSGIIYCFSRKQVDELYSELDKAGFSVLPYHAGLTDSVRAKNQDLFIKDKVQIMVATIAFGMGINKPNVRFVIHYDLPKSVEEYYQEIGRAGRDGLPSSALLLYSGADAHKIRFFFEEAASPEKSEFLLQQMLRYATTRKCRRAQLLSYFGERFENTGSELSPEDCCDICAAGPVPESDTTVPAQMFMSCVLRLKERYGISYVIDVLLGSKQERILNNHHNELSTWGIGKGLEKNEWFEVAEALLEKGYICKTGDYNVLQVLPKGRVALAKREEILLPVLIHQKKVLNMLEKTQQKPSFVLHKKGEFVRNCSPADLELYNKIKEWRKTQADEQNVPPYVIFGDKTLEELVQKKPRTEAELLNVFGIGAVKAEKIGSSILRILKDN